MNAHTPDEQQELTEEEHIARLAGLRMRKNALSQKPLSGDTLYDWVDLWTAYDNAGYTANADNISRRIASIA